MTLARVLEGMDEAEKALVAINKALELEPSNPLHHFEQGRYLMALGDFTSARTSYEKAVELGSQLHRNPLFSNLPDAW